MVQSARLEIFVIKINLGEKRLVEGVTGVDLKGLEATHHWPTLAVSKCLCLHQSFHVCSLSIFAGTDDSRISSKTSGNLDLGDCFSIEFIHELDKCAVLDLLLVRSASSSSIDTFVSNGGEFLSIKFTHMADYIMYSSAGSVK